MNKYYLEIFGIGVLTILKLYNPPASLWETFVPGGRMNNNNKFYAATQLLTMGGSTPELAMLPLKLGGVK